ncbi:MAG: HU family DNA-binding protein, partial [Planctomycetota bacterium]|nr:HU family DNA-binding protein [Planctomycetota bacterium]
GVVDVLATERRLELRNFGVFEVRPVKSHKARNPRTGAQVLVPDRHRVVFKAGRVMRRRLRESTTK